MGSHAKPVVGLTGGIGTGKSTAAACFEELGVPIIDADALAREAVRRGSEGYQQVIATFGEGMLKPDGDIDRKRLGDLVFSDANALAKLNAIVHPKVAALSAAQIADFEGSITPYVIYNAALLVEVGLYKELDALVVVEASEKQQYQRLIKRDELSLDDIKARLTAQLPAVEKRKVADYVIDNNGSKADLEAQVGGVHRALVRRFAYWRPDGD